MIPAVIIAAILILLAAAVAVAYQQANIIHIGKAHIVRLEGELIHANEGSSKRIWELRPDAVNPMVERGRDVSAPRQAMTLPGEVEVQISEVKIGEVDVWDSVVGRYLSERTHNG